MDALSYDEKKRSLIDEITTAFDGVELGEGVSFHESAVIDDHRIDDRNHPLRVEARAKDTEARWQDVPDEDIRNGWSCLNFLDATGFHYYLPAYIVWYLRNMDTEDPDFDSDTFERVIYSLGAIDVLLPHQLERFKRFTPRQSKAIAHFLVFDADGTDAHHDECEQWRREMLLSEGHSQEEIGDRGYSPTNDARRALQNYWGQFVE